MRFELCVQFEVQFRGKGVLCSMRAANGGFIQMESLKTYQTNEHWAFVSPHAKVERLPWKFHPRARSMSI